jgi:hypothetical protein
MPLLWRRYPACAAMLPRRHRAWLYACLAGLAAHSPVAAAAAAAAWPSVAGLPPSARQPDCALQSQSCALGARTSVRSFSWRDQDLPRRSVRAHALVPTTCMCGPASTVLHQVSAARSQCRREIKRPQARPGLPHLPSSIVRGVTTIRSVTDADGCSCLASDQCKAGFGTGRERLQPGSTVDHARLHGMCRYMLALSVA